MKPSSILILLFYYSYIVSLHVFTKLRKKNIFTLNEKIKILDSLLVWLQSNIFTYPLRPGQSKVLFHVFFPVFFFFFSPSDIISNDLEIYVLSLSLKIIHTTMRMLSPLFLGVQVYCSYSVCI